MYIDPFSYCEQLTEQELLHKHPYMQGNLNRCSFSNLFARMFNNLRTSYAKAGENDEDQSLKENFQSYLRVISCVRASMNSSSLEGVNDTSNFKVWIRNLYKEIMQRVS